MHVAFFSDQNPATLGGLQVSLGLQRDSLEQAGHAVTVCAPRTRRSPSPQYARSHDVLLRAAQFGEHSLCGAGPAADRAIDEGFERLPAVDVVHIQADVWGAWNGYRFARRHGLPVVHTMHTNVEVGLPAVVPFPSAVFRLLFAQQQRHLRTGPVRDIAGYVRAFARNADALIVPSAHFAERLAGYGVDREVNIIPTGVDDRKIASLLARPRRPHQRPVLVCPGRLSKEKRVEDLIEAIALSGADVELHIYGAGPALSSCRDLAEYLGIADRVLFFGSVSHDVALSAMHEADAVVQSSIGYETQGLTVYEAIAVGTPVLVRDRNIAVELPTGWYHVPQNDSVMAFAEALRALAARITLSAHRQEPPTAYSQRALTKQILDVYRGVLHASVGISETRNAHVA